MPLHARKKRPGILRTLVDIYWPLVVFGGIAAGFTLWKSGPDALWAGLAKLVQHPMEHLPLWLAAGACILLTPLLVILMTAQRREKKNAQSPENPLAPDSTQSEEEPFPELNYRLTPARASGGPQTAQSVIISQTRPASSAGQSAGCLKLTLEGQREAEIPLLPGVHKFQAAGFTVTLSVTPNPGTVLEDITRELPIQQ